MSYELKKEDIYGFASSVGADTHQKGDELFFKYCPYCEGGSNRDKQTFSINLTTGTYKCFRASCGASGHFVQLARDFNYPLDFGEQKEFRQLPQKKIVSNNAAVEYMKSRGISQATTERYKITTWKDNENIIVFPFYDENNQLVFVKYRDSKFVKPKKGEPKRNKEWSEEKTKAILFGMAQCEDFSTLIITEGQIDSLSVADCGIKNACSVPTGAVGFTWLNHCWDWVAKFKEVIVFGDWEKGKMTLLDTLSKRLPQKVRAVQKEDYLGEKDANDIYRKYGKSAIVRCIENAKPLELNNIKGLETVQTVDLNALPKIKTNIKPIDRIIGGIVFGQVYLLTGKRGQGKSTFMSQIGCEALDQNYPTLIYSGELPDYHFKRWLDFQLAGGKNITVSTNEFGDEVYSIKQEIVDKLNAWYKGKAYIYDNTFIPESEDEKITILETIEKAIKQYGIKVICIDNLMTAMDTATTTSDLYMMQSKFVGDLKRIAMKYDVAVILVAHPRKSNNDFSNDDVAGSADITNKVDVVMSYKRIDDNDDYNGELQITKNRINGIHAMGKNAIKLNYSAKSKRITGSLSDNRKYGWEVESDNETTADSFFGDMEDYEEF